MKYRYKPLSLPIFDITCRKAYKLCEEDEELRFDIDDILEIMHYFFKKYKEIRGESHPPQSIENLMHIIRELCAPVGDVYLDSEEYKELIDYYFEQNFNNCDYRINHFLSGDIRLILGFYAGYISYY